MTNHENAANEVRKAFTEAGVEFEAFETPAKPEFGTTGHFAYVVAGAKGFEVEFENWHGGVYGEGGEWVVENSGDLDGDDVDFAPVVEWVRNWCAERA